MTSRDDPHHSDQQGQPSVSEPAPDAPAATSGTASPNHTTVRPAAPPADGRITVTMPDGRQPVAPGPPPAPEEVPGYEILAELGRGGMGVVYKAKQLGLNRLVALKLMLGGSRGGSFLHRFMVEAEAVAAIKHPNVVEVYDYGKSFNGHPFLALEFCPGGSLADHLARHHNAPRTADSARQVAALIAQVARGVAAVHAQGIVHRDLNPNNVLLDASGVPKIADFGLAKRGAGADVTQVGDVVGTPAYMSPEQARGESKFVGPQADVWALGVMLYEALTGRELFTGTLQEVFAKVMNARPVAPSRVVRTIPRDLDLICLKCLDPEPYERYPTARRVADDLERYVRDESISVYPPGPLEGALRWVRQNLAVSAAAAIVFLALAVVACVLYHSGEEARAEQKKTAQALERALTAEKEANAERQKALAAVETVSAQKRKVEGARDLARDRSRMAAGVFGNLIADLDQELAKLKLDALRGPLLALAIERLEGLAMELLADTERVDTDHTLVAVHVLIGELSHLRRDADKAHKHFMFAVAHAQRIRDKAEPEDQRGATRDHGRALVRLAVFLAKTDKPDEAREHFDEAIGIFSVLAAKDKSDDETRIELDKARNGRAKLLPAAPAAKP